MLDVMKAQKFIDQCWSDEIVPALVEYIKIPNKSPLSPAQLVPAPGDLVSPGRKQQPMGELQLD